MKFSNIEDLMIMTRKNKLDLDSSVINIEKLKYNYNTLCNLKSDSYNLVKSLNNCLIMKPRWCVMIDEFSDECINNLINCSKEVNIRAFNYLKFNTDFRYLTKNVEKKINNNIEQSSYYFIADDIYSFFESRNKFAGKNTTVNNCIIFLENEEKSIDIKQNIETKSLFK